MLTTHKIVAKFASYKDKQKTLCKCNYLKRIGIYISTRMLRRRFSKLGSRAGTGNAKQGKYVILVYDRIYTR